MTIRSRDQDACPGALSVHRAADGALARVRLPGGMLSGAQLTALAQAAIRFGAPDLELTSRGNVQIRGITDTDAVAEAGLLPSPTHERVRNVVASPLSGRSGGLADVRPLVVALDTAIQCEPALAESSGRFWFGLDDGRGDISGLGTDVGVHAVDREHAALLLAGRDTGVRLRLDDAVSTLIDVAVRFVRVRGTAWRVDELPTTQDLLTLPPTAEPGATWPPVVRPPVGWIPQDDGRVTLGAAVPLGVLPARTAEFVGAIESPVVVTPWRSLAICDLDEGVADVALRVLAPMGLVFDGNSRWLDVSACTGTPGCERSAADVRADAAAAVDDPAGGHRHFVGCERCCGSPPVGEVLIAGPDGYRARGRPS
ncbi:precorrin-3B synthase [Mycolicibacterium baixiangningiae]|uniref:precorrin-3B synthase n=1 Tax=Mycolicibacterium baixiangningiae TaxID=2761578 RepID=UPI0018D040CB|nr:precorrin-3B synthase [Mycolicibacterium baixiangningiae]